MVPGNSLYARSIDIIMHWTVFVVCVTVFGVFNSMCDQEGVIVATNYGILRGKRLEVTGVKVDAYLGVPYAEPPVGDYRFKPANPWSMEWDGVRDATSFGNACWQRKLAPAPENFRHVWWTPEEDFSEDCLFLNVWTPYPSPSDVSVVVFIHGGSFSSGASSPSLYDGATLAVTENVVVVSMNYRLGPLGFLAFYTDEEPGNLGLVDQAMALLWIQDNIEHFGGNPDSVTLIGHSAGAASVGFHMLSPLSRPFFHRAILQSGAPNTGWAISSKSEATWLAGKLARDVGCPTWLNASNAKYESILPATLSCLRERDPSELINAAVTSIVGGYIVVVDGNFLPDNPQWLLADGAVKSTPIIIGTVDDEGILNMGDLPSFSTMVVDIDAIRNEFSIINYEQSIEHYFPYVEQSIRDAIGFQYRDWVDPYNGTKLHRSIIELWEDYCMVCSVKEFANFYAAAGNDVYAYNFNHRVHTSPWPEWFGTVHTDELLFSLGLAMHDEERLSDIEKELSRKMLRYWANYARTGDPNDDPLSPAWPRYTTEEPAIMNFNTKNSARIGEYGRVEECAFWSELVPLLARDDDTIAGFHPIFLPTMNMTSQHELTTVVTCAAVLTMTSSDIMVVMLVLQIALYMC